ncbi:MAG TPA: hypothetical protein VLR90_21975 [Blastocatellia bacterium]|nr:hypothetical protein [Blastocatellia bacterium]
MAKGSLGSLVIACVFLLLSLASSVEAQTGECRTIDESANYIVRSVKVEGRWTASLNQLDLNGLVGQKYSPPLVSQAQEKVSAYLSKDENKTIESKVLGMYSVLYIRSCVLADDQAKAVDIVIKPIYARVDLYKVGSNVLPIPRSLLPTFYDSVPAPLLAFNPGVGIDYDRENGTTPSLSISTNLLDLPKLLSGKGVSKSDVRLDLKAWGRKSIENPFYNVGADLALSRRRDGSVLEALAIEGHFRADEQPLGGGRYLKNAARLGASVQIHPDSKVFNRISVGGKYRWSNNRLVNGNDLKTTEQAFEARSIIDGRLGGGFSRLAVWMDAASPSKQSGSYRRLAGVFGLEKEFGATNQTVGVEALAGAGRAWGATPEYARFFGGNSARNFLYEGQDSPLMTELPVGPLIRSFGQSQAASPSSRGGTSYWHMNLNVSLPLPGLSRSLIPRVPIQNDDGSTILLKDKLKGFAIGSAVGGIADTMIDQIIDELTSQGMSEDDAEQKAAEIAQKRAEKLVGKEIKPTIEFIADKANLYALKPLIMIDAARINAPGSSDNRTRFAIGGGLQFTIVVARFEAGYLRTVRRQQGDSHGNFILRLVFQNLF